LAAAPALSTNLFTAPLIVPDASFSVIRVFGALILVLGLFLAGVWVFKNWQRLASRRGRAAHLRLIEVKPLTGKHVLYVVGYQQQRLLLASSPSGVSLVSHLPAADAAEATELEPSQVASPTFVQALQQAVQGKS
jgi:flagellar biogenesis protein FliO